MQFQREINFYSYILVLSRQPLGRSLLNSTTDEMPGATDFVLCRFRNLLEHRTSVVSYHLDLPVNNTWGASIRRVLTVKSATPFLTDDKLQRNAFSCALNNENSTYFLCVESSVAKYYSKDSATDVFSSATSVSATDVSLYFLRKRRPFICFFNIFPRLTWFLS